MKTVSVDLVVFFLLGFVFLALLLAMFRSWLVMRRELNKAVTRLRVMRMQLDSLEARTGRNEDQLRQILDQEDEFQALRKKLRMQNLMK